MRDGCNGVIGSAYRRVKKLLEIALGIVTSVGGFLEAGSLATAAQAGAAFRFELLWAVGLGTLCVACLVEMSGRLAAVSHHTVVAAMRERFGVHAFMVPLITVLLVSLLTLGAEVGGVCMALQLATGVAFQWWAVPVMVTAWALLWRGSFGLVEQGVSLLGLVTVAFLVAAVRLRPSITEVARGLVPGFPDHEPAKYGFLTVSILGASLTPYLFYFYSSGAIEDRWNRSHLGINRLVATVGMGFGGVLSAAVLVVAAVTFHTRGMRVESYGQLALLMDDAFGGWGVPLFVVSLGIACFGAALEISLAIAYMIAQGFGWNWGENVKPHDAARFAAVYTLALVVATVLVIAGVDPLRLTNMSMALTAMTLPVAALPFLVLMNDRDYLGRHVNGRIANAVVLLVVGLGSVLAVVALPLQLFGS
jgi:Mn2+/Fe2+ NRAMP family transporter